LQQDLESDRVCAARWAGVLEVWKGVRIAVGPRRLRHSERRKRLGRDDPGRDARHEVLRQEGPERLILPCLDVARRPIVQQAEARNVILGILDGDWLTELVA